MQRFLTKQIEMTSTFYSNALITRY